MFIPLPLLIAAALVFLALLAIILRSSRRRDPLLGGQQERAMPPLPVAASKALSPEIEAEVRALLAAGRKIDAIKVARDATGLGLRDTKELVEGFE